jgi:uncharacterized protein YifN (PemK superfamily)
MAIKFHPEQGTIVVCDFSGFNAPEMTKRRPAIVLSARLRRREGLCTVVPMSTTPPHPQMAYHYRLHTAPPLPPPYSSDYHWVKADMLYTVSFKRLFLMSTGKDLLGVREYDIRILDKAEIRAIQACALHGLGMADLTNYL